MSRKMTKMVVDWSVLMYNNWHKMRSPNFEARTSLEAAEFARNIVTHLLYLITRIQPDVLVLAVDSVKNWRSDVYSRYYENNVTFFRWLDHPKIWAVQFDKKTYSISFHDGMGKWTYKKLSLKDQEGYGLEDPERWQRYSPDSLDDFLKVREHEDWPALEHIIPTYKGNRKSGKWDYETTKAEFKALGQNLAFNVAPLFDGVAVQVQMAEGDDVCCVFVDECSEDEDVVLVTIDTDLHQLLISHDNLRIFDTRLHAWVDKSPELAKYELTHKIMKGDTSDNICGISMKGANSTLGDKGAAKIIEDAGGPDEVWDILMDEYELDEEGEIVLDEEGDPVIKRPGDADKAPLERNLELIALTQLPAELKAKIQEGLEFALANKKSPEFTLDNFGVTTKDRLLTKMAARGDREIDLNGDSKDPLNSEDLGLLNLRALAGADVPCRICGENSVAEGLCLKHLAEEVEGPFFYCHEESGSLFTSLDPQLISDGCLELIDRETYMKKKASGNYQVDESEVAP